MQAERQVQEGARPRALSDDERNQVLADAKRDFDAELEAGLTTDFQRVTRARDNTRAMRGLMEALDFANQEAPA